MMPDHIKTWGTYKVWICQNSRCRRALKVEPKGKYKPGCQCKVPELPPFPTTVTTFDPIHDLGVRP